MPKLLVAARTKAGMMQLQPLRLLRLPRPSRLRRLLLLPPPDLCVPPRKSMFFTFA